MKRFHILDIPIDSCDEARFREKSAEFLRANAFHHIATVNPEFLVTADGDKKFKNILQNTELNICDGAGIQFLSGLLYGKRLSRLSGVRAAELLCEVAEKLNKSVYLIGGFGVAQKSAEILKKKFPNLKIAGAEDGNPEKISQQLIGAKPDIVLVAFGAPKQEYFIDKLKESAEIPSLRIAIGIGGTFDFWTGKVRRAPKWLRYIGLEWTWRLFLQPERWRRIVNAVFVFSWLVIKEKL